jgi:hypothetical protein
MKNPVNNLPDKTLVLTPNRLFSLWEMIEFLGYDFISLLLEFDHEGREAYQKVKEYGPCFATGEDKRRLNSLLHRLSVHCERLGFTESNNKIRHFLSRVQLIQSAPFQVIESEISGLRYALLCDLHRNRFTFVPPHRACYFEQEDAFGVGGSPFKPLASDEINSEIKAASNCLSADLNTAAVFHAIRTAELGMRRLASRLRAPVYREQKRIKIEDATWNEVLLGIKNKVESEKQKPKSKRRIKSYFRDYEILAGQLNRLKDDRNEVMHTHDEFKASEALGVFERVRDFMQKLAKRIPLK